MSADLLREAAGLMRGDVAAGRADAEDPFLPALADWLDAEAKYDEQEKVKQAAVNVLLILSDEAGDVPVRVRFGYSTTDQAVAVARAYLGRDS